VALILLPGTSFLGGVAAADNTAMAAFFFMWGLFTLAMFFGTLKTNRGLQFVFGSLFVLFFMLMARELMGTPWFGLILSRALRA